MTALLRSEQFEALLQQLGPDRDFAGARYEELRRRLVVVFRYRGCPYPEELADETLDRVARRIQEMGSEFDGSDPARFVFGVAWNVARESFRRPSTVPLPEAWEWPPSRSTTPSSSSENEPEHACLDRCLEDLPLPERDLLLDYHQGERSARIRRRSALADGLRLTPNALRLKIHRLTCALRACVSRCMDEGAAAEAGGTA